MDNPERSKRFYNAAQQFKWLYSMEVGIFNESINH
jgi:hypothetical protein